ncbi:hypothetical protein FHR92_002042 [Fontibacillus solani]|uniref:Uncharacterized protein n=1 Tax=Fontibacillus solani TaxID=1572857 RepID=A0A7W3SSQ6_9BACL|nr:hypothetical protein [Fontibacillus solani]
MEAALNIRHVTVTVKAIGRHPISIGLRYSL